MTAEVHLWEIEGNYIDFRDFTKKELVDLIENIFESGFLTTEQLKAVGSTIDFWIDERDTEGSFDKNYLYKRRNRND